MISSKYGPTLGLEFREAGVGGLPFSWDDNGVYFSDSVTEEQRAIVLSVMEAHDNTAVLPVVEVNPVDKLKEFLNNNPDVAALLQGTN